MPRGSVIAVKTWYYQQFDADHSREVPGEGYGGWRTADLPFDDRRSAFIFMHAWDCGTAEEFPGWWRAVEYIPRAVEISRKVFPGLLSALRGGGATVIHVVSEQRFKPARTEYPGYRRAERAEQELFGPAAVDGRVEELTRTHVRGDIHEQLSRFHHDSGFPGAHNQADIDRGRHRQFLPDAEPIGEEYVVGTARRLLAVSVDEGIDHLVYAGFAVNWCLLMSPCGMLDMSRHGFMCSVIRDAVTAVENRETARTEMCKELGLWRTALAFGYVYDADDLIDRYGS